MTPSVSTPRVGLGVDVHAFATEPRPLVLGGHEVDPERGLDGHSDADVVCHALVDALLSAVGAGDIGTRFGVDRPETAGASSLAMLRAVREELAADGWTVGNVAVTVLAQVPRLGPHRGAVRAGVAAALAVGTGAVNVAFTTTDGLGLVGRADGIACQAVALVERAAEG